MAGLETGDIIINLDGVQGYFSGHAMVCYSDGPVESYNTVLVHAVNGLNFHKVGNLFDAPNNSGAARGVARHFQPDKHWLFRPPWMQVYPRDEYIANFRKILDSMTATGSEWTFQRGATQFFSDFRFFGGCNYDHDARLKVTKYKMRGRSVLAGGTPPFGYIIKQVTCAEAVIVPYQILFDEDSVMFIKIAAHKTWPKDLKAHLEGLCDQNTGWLMQKPGADNLTG